MRAKPLVSRISPARLGVNGGLLLLLVLTGAPAVSLASDGEPEQRSVTGVVRDFRRAHSDFDIDIPCTTCYGHFAGLVDVPLGEDERPVLLGTRGYRVVRQWLDRDGRAIAPHLFGVEYGCANVNDTPGTTGVDNSGSISSRESFDQWFRDVPGENLSAPLSLTLTRNAEGVFEFVSTAFHPIDGQLFGNEDQPHNNNFTFALTVHFMYEECEGKFIEFRGGDGMWLFVGGQLVMDLGGVITRTQQRVDLDRLGLEDGVAYDLHIFYAQRERAQSEFRLRTNVELLSEEEPPMISASFD